MVKNLILGYLTMTVCLTVQCMVVSLLLRILVALEIRGLIRPTLIRASFLLVTVMLIMSAGNLLQVALWAGLYCSLGEFHDFTTAFYHSVVNFATLGYGDIVLSARWRLLGALEAINGVLMFGLTTGFLYTVLRALMQRAWDDRLAQVRLTEQSSP